MPSRHPRPTPPRFWWLKRVAPTVVLVGVAWAGFHLWLTRRVEAELAARVEQWRAEGDGPLPEQMNAARGLPPATVNGEPNAADLLTRAMTALPPLTRTQLDEWDNFEGPQMPIPADRLAVVRSIVAQDAAALPPARRAIDAPAVDWNQPPMGLFGIGNYNEMRALATHLKWSSSLAHHDGDLAASLTDARAILRLASAVPEYSPSLISGLIAAGCDAMAASQLRDAAWHRPPGLSPDQEAEAWRAARPVVEAAIRDLLDSNHDTTLIRRSWQGERASMALIAADPAAAAGAGTGTPAAARPFFTAGLLPLLDALSDAADAARTPVISAAPTDWQNRLAGGDSAAGTSFTLLTAILVPSLDRANQAFFKSIAERRAEAVVLAAKLFHAETGRWPASLDDLMPTYLPRVPDDPFAPPGTPLRLRTDAAVPVVYSVGEDRSDDGGSTAWVGTASRWPAGWPASQERLDYVLPLYLPPAAERFPRTFNVWYWLQDPAAAEALAEQDELDLQNPDADSEFDE